MADHSTVRASSVLSPSFTAAVNEDYHKDGYDDDDDNDDEAFATVPVADRRAQEAAMQSDAAAVLRVKVNALTSLAALDCEEWVFEDEDAHGRRGRRRGRGQ